MHRCAGIHIQTGEEVGIKLVCCKPCWPRAVRRDAEQSLTARVRAAQESVKTKHPQLLYESKLYKILQGGSKPLAGLSLMCFGRPARR